MNTIITSIAALPTDPYSGTNTIGIIITNGFPTYFKIIGTNLNKITKITWYPNNPQSIEFIIRDLILVDNTIGTFMIRVINNFLYSDDRGGKLSIRTDTGETIIFPVKTYGPVSYRPLWISPYDGLDTGS